LDTGQLYRGLAISPDGQHLAYFQNEKSIAIYSIIDNTVTEIVQFTEELFDVESRRAVRNFVVASNYWDLDYSLDGTKIVTDIRAIRRMVENAGYDGLHEVEIFSARDWWTRDPDEVVRIVKKRHRTAV
jgi:hypothetical protein